jgi:Tol biopolymer transport system component
MRKRACAIVVLGVMSLLSGCGSDGPTAASGADPSVTVPWSLLSGQIAVVTGRCGGGPTACESFLYVVNAGSRQIRQIATVGEPNHFLQLSWSPGGDELAYASYALSASAQLWKIRADGTGRTPIFASEAHNSSPAWSSDGRLAYRFSGTRDNTVVTGVFIDGQPFLIGDIQVGRMAWSPSSDHMVVAMRQGAEPQVLFRAALDGSAPVRISPMPAGPSPEASSNPVYSPDGSRLAFEFFRQGGASGITVMNPDGSGMQLLAGGVGGRLPTWSADGSSILFIRDDGLFIMNSAGTGVVRVLAFREGLIRDVAWIP